MIESPENFNLKKTDGYLMNLFPEFIALVHSLKSTVKTEPVNLEGVNRIYKIVKKLALSMIYQPIPPIKNNYEVFISKKSSLASKIQILYNKKDTLRQGELFGYPACCIDAFVKFPRDPRIKEEQAPYGSLINTLKNGGSFNGLLKFGMGYHLISHFPCRYDCKPSIAYATKLLNLIIKSCNNKIWVNSLLHHLNRPIIKALNFYYDLYSSEVELRQDNSYNIICQELMPFQKASVTSVHLKQDKNGITKEISLYKLFSSYNIICKYDKRAKKQIFFAVSPEDNQRYAILENGLSFFFLPFRLNKRCQ